MHQTVAVLHWPRERATREELASAGTPRLLLVPAPHAPPSDGDELEDWLRLPGDGTELAARRERLARRFATVTARPVVDGDGLLWFGDRSTAVPERQVPLVEVLVGRFGEVVAHREVAAALRSGGASAHPEALKAAMSRLARRAAAVGLSTIRVRGRGYILDAT